MADSGACRMSDSQAPQCGHGSSATDGIGGCAAVVLADGDGGVTGDALAAEGTCCSCRLTPHFLQNLAGAATTCPQAGHEMVAEVFGTGVPHAPQTSAFGSISLAQLWQCIAGVVLAATPMSDLSVTRGRCYGPENRELLTTWILCSFAIVRLVARCTIPTENCQPAAAFTSAFRPTPSTEPSNRNSVIDSLLSVIPLEIPYGGPKCGILRLRLIPRLCCAVPPVQCLI